MLDQMLSMHAALRDRAARTATGTRVALLCLSAVGVAFAFAGPDREVTLLGVAASRSAWLGWLAVLVFAGNLADLVAGRRALADRHAAAANRLGELKLDYRRVPHDGDWGAAAPALTARYNEVMDRLPPIPERQFNGLKAAHLRKIAVSQTLSANPGLSHRQAQRRVTRTAKSTADHTQSRTTNEPSSPPSVTPP